MSFYSGKPGKSFTIDRVFKNYKEMYSEAKATQSPENSINNYYIAGVPVGAFVMISYGMGSADLDSTDGEYYQNRLEDLEWFKANPSLHPGRAAADYNATLWWDMPWADGGDYNASVWVKRWTAEKGYYYDYVANVGGIVPEIIDGYWYVGQTNTGVRAAGRQVQFRVLYDVELATYALLSKDEEGATIYGLSNLSEKYLYNEATQRYEPSSEGEYILVYSSNEEGTFIADENGDKTELGYSLLSDWNAIQIPEQPKFKSDYMQWKFEDEEEWTDLFDVTGLTSIYEYMNDASLSAQSAANSLEDIKIIDESVKATKEEIDKGLNNLDEAVASVEGYIDDAKTNYEKTSELIDALVEWNYGETTDKNTIPAGAIVYNTEIVGDVTTYYYKTVASTIIDPDMLSAAEVIQARGNFPILVDRLNNNPFQFNLITDMQACIGLQRGQKAFTFGMDEVGDDDSKLFEMFDPKIPEDKEKLDAIDPDSITDTNPTGTKKISEQYNLANGLVAGMLTVFSGKGSGGGGGGTVGSITTTFDSANVKSGESIIVGYYWTSPNAGQGTLFVKDSASSSVIDSATGTNYSVGVKVSQGNGTFSLKPTDGVHRLTLYVIDRGGILTNEATVTITAGGIEIVSAPADGQSYPSNQQIVLNYGIKTIYKTDKVILNYEVYQNGVLIPNLSGTQEAAIAGSSVSIPVVIKKSTDDIGRGQFRINATAYMKSDPTVTTDPVVRNFIIAEQNTIYLTTTYNENEPQYQNTPIYIPLTLVYSGGSVFNVKGRYSTQETFVFNEGEILGSADGVETRAGSFVYQATFAETGTYYVQFEVTGKGISATGRSEVIKITVDVASAQYTLQQSEALTLNLSARQGQTNNANKTYWRNSVPTYADSIYGILRGFNYSSNGWEAGTNGIPTGYLFCNSEAYATVNCNIFQGFYNNPGVTVECVFKAADIGLNQTIFDYSIGAGQGLFIYKNKAVANIGNEVQNLTARFNCTGIDADDEPIHIAFVFDRTNKYAKIYLNGVMTAAATIPDGSTAFTPSISNAQIFLNTNSSLSIFGISKIDAVRVYHTALTDDEILKNYIYNLRDSDLQRAKWLKNGLDNDQMIADEVPYMTFYLNQSQWENMTKDVKYEIRVDYHDPKLDPVDRTWYNVKTCWQGTSSIAYPVKNFKIKLGKDLDGKKQKFALGDGKCLKENTFCLKADYMDSSHTHNTGNANFIHESGIITKQSLTPPQSDELGLDVATGMKGLPEGKDPGKLKTRTSIYGYPVLLYICIETEESAAVGQYKSPAAEAMELELEPLTPQYKEYKAIPKKDRTDEQKTFISDYEDKEDALNKQLALDDIEMRDYASPMFWGIYNFNLDKGATDSFGLYRENQDIDNLPRFQDCTSFEISANTAYSGGGFRMIKFVKNKKDGSYGWSKPNVYYSLDENNNYQVNLSSGDLLQIINADATGAVTNEKVTLTKKHDDITYTGLYNENLEIKGFCDRTKRYTETGRLDSQGLFIALYKINEETLDLATDESGYILLGYYDYYTDINAWSVNVPLATEKYSPITEWEVQELPENKDYYYNYYIEDFELRYPDMDMYLCNINGKESYNQLFYKEYDKLIPFVEWVDSHPLTLNGENVIQTPGPDGKTFVDGIKEHLDIPTAIAYYLTTMTVGLIDNFGKNLMIDTWGYNSKGEVPYKEKVINDVTYHCVSKYISNWDEDEEVYTDSGSFEYGLMDMTNPIVNEDGSESYNVYKSSANFELTDELIDTAMWGFVEDDRITGWYHEIDYSQIIWYPHFYDLDSCLGLNNSGVLLFTPSIEMNDGSYIDAVSNQRVFKAPFNTSESALWSKFSNGLAEDISKYFAKVKQDNILTVNTFKKFYYDNIVSTMGERWYNGDAEPKYLSRKPIKVVINGITQNRYPIEFINIAYGNDWQRIETWLTQRISYLESMFDRKSAVNSGSMEFRGSDQGYVYSFKVETYEPAYMRIIPKNGAAGIYKRVDNFDGSCILTVGSAIGAADQEMYILPANNIKRISEVNHRGFSSVKPAYASRLLELDLQGSAALETIAWSQAGNLADNTAADGGEMSTNLMQSINLNGCTKYNGTISGQSFPLLKTIDLRGTAAGFSFSSSGGIVQEAYLSSATKQINIQSYYDLKKLSLELKYPEGIKSGNAQSGHSTNISTFIMINCPQTELAIDYKIKDSNDNWITPTGTTEVSEMRNFINTYGTLALFQNIGIIIIDDSLTIPETIDSDGDTVKELKLSLSNLGRVKIVNSDINKIAFIANSYMITDENNYITNLRASYPGNGGEPASNDEDYVATIDDDYGLPDGLTCDTNITKVEIRGSSEENNSSATFQLPWRTYLGSLAGLQKLKLNVGTLSPKPIGVTDLTSGYLLGITSTNATPKRFELVLPQSGGRETEDGNFVEGFNSFYINPSVKTLDFTSVRQNDGLVNYVREGNLTPAVMKKTYTVTNLDNRTSTVTYFAGIDIRGYDALKMNFKGFKKITGIMGMDSLDVGGIKSLYGDKAFESYFEDCQALQELYESSVGDNKLWNFSNWTTTGLSNQFTSINRFFANCYSLKTPYVQGWGNFKGQLLESASQMFAYCRTITDIKINWPNSAQVLSNVENMFQQCSALTRADITIDKANSIKSLRGLFDGCSNLIEPKVSIFVLDENGTSIDGMASIQDTTYMFRNCVSLKTLDMAEQHWNFNELLTATGMFDNCKELRSITFMDNMNLTKATNLNELFRNCNNLLTIFDNSIENKVILNDGSTSAGLSVKDMFNGCESLSSIGNLIYADTSRINDMQGLFASCRKLQGSHLDPDNYASNIFDLSNWHFNKPANIISMFSNCEILKQIILPTMVVNGISGLMQSCYEMTSVDLSNLTLDSSVNSFSSMFSGCSKMNSITGYENWTPLKVSSMDQMFQGCNLITELDLSNWRMKSLTTMANAFNGCSQLQVIHGLRDLFGVKNDVIAFAGYDYVGLTKMEGLFNGCYNLRLGVNDSDACDMKNWGKAMKNVSSFSALFKDCRAITSVNSIFAYLDSNEQPIVNSYTPYVGMETFNNLSNLSEMFAGCTGLKKIDYFTANKFKLATASLTSIQSMISGCTNLTDFYLTGDKMSLENLVNGGINNLFTDCRNLITIGLMNNSSLKQSIDLSPLAYYSVDTGNRWVTFTNTVYSWLYDFSTTPRDENNNEGVLTLSSAQDAFAETLKTKAVTDKKWIVGGI